MLQQMERLGFQCTGVEHSKRTISVAKRLRKATESKYELWRGSIFDYPDADKHDVVLALNIFHHFTKTEEMHTELVKLLGRLRADVIMFEPHLSHQPGKMDGAYRNYPPEEFAEFVAEHARLDKIVFLGREEEHYSQWKRPLYMLSRA